jgi:putative heme-binding domain-containing protein
MRLAVLNSVGDRALELFVKLLPQDRLMAGAQGAKSGAASHLDPFLRQLVALLGARLQKEEVNRVLDLLGKLESPAQACVLASALSEGIQRSGRTLGHFVEQTRLENLVQGALSLLQNSQAPEQSKLAAVRLLGQGQFPLVRESLRSMLQPSQPTGLQKAAVDSLASFAEPDSAQDLLSAWSGLTPTLRAQVVETLLRRPERCARLLGALESGELRRADLSASQTEFLRKHLDPALRERAGRILGQAPSSSRQEAVRAFAGALRLSGDPERGRKIYLERCASCHRLAGQGHAFGPDLETVRANGREMLLGNLLDPNREVTPKYVNYLAETQDGESLTGLVTMESDTTVVLRQANDREVTLLRSNLTQFRSLGQSAMPEGLEEGLAVQDLADLMEYVLLAR